MTGRQPGESNLDFMPAGPSLFRWRHQARVMLHFAPAQLAHWHDDRLLEDLEWLASLRSVCGVWASPDAFGEDWGTPSGVAVTARHPDGPIFPTMISAPHDGYRVIALSLDASVLRKPVNRQRLIHALRSTLASTSESRVRRLNVDIKRVVEDGESYLRDAGIIRMAPANATQYKAPEFDWSYLPAAVRRAARSQFGSAGRGAHYVSFERVVTADDPARPLGIKPDQLIVVVHVGSEGLAFALKNSYWMTLARAAVATGMTDPEQVLHGRIAVPASHPHAMQFLAAVRAVQSFADNSRAVATELVLDCIVEALGVSFEDLGARLISDLPHSGIWEGEDEFVQAKGVQIVGGAPDDTPTFLLLGGYPSFLLEATGDDSRPYPHGRTNCWHLLNADSVNAGFPETYASPSSRLGRWRGPIPLETWMALERQNIEASLQCVEDMSWGRRAAELWPILRYWGQPKRSTAVLKRAVISSVTTAVDMI